MTEPTDEELFTPVWVEHDCSPMCHDEHESHFPVLPAFGMSEHDREGCWCLHWHEEKEFK